ncbi:MAG: ribose 5-phosphate isomerase B [Planctomycetes bacterium]|nr:ribose 5-phosphate isomerase B [Planctomycetota bacterium]
MQVRKIAVAADHGGYALKERVVRRLEALGFEVEDLGTKSAEAVDYPEFAYQVAKKVASGSCQRGIVVDGIGIASAIVANKVAGIRATPCQSLSEAKSSRDHNDANVLTLGGRLLGEGLALEMVELWLSTPFGGGRHARRVEQIAEIDRREGRK